MVFRDAIKEVLLKLFFRGVQAKVCPDGKVIMKIIYINKNEMSALNTEQGWGTCVVLILPLIS